MKRGIVKCSNWEGVRDESFSFMSYFYLHGKAEELNGFDCCEGDLQTFSNIISMSTRVVTLLMKDGTEHTCLLLVTINDNRMSGLICLVDDLEAIKSAYNYYERKPNLLMYEHDEKFLEENYLQTRVLLSELRRTI